MQKFNAHFDELNKRVKKKKVVKFHQAWIFGNDGNTPRPTGSL